MENDAHKKFAILMGMLGTAFSDKGILAAKIEMYWEHLHGLPIDALGEAVCRIIKTRKFSSFPTIAEIRDAVLGNDDEIERAALEAWGRAERAVSRGIHLKDGSAMDEAICVAFGGWNEFGATDPENSIADRAHFIRVFKGLARARREKGELALEPGREPIVLPKGQDVVHKLTDKFRS